MTENLNLHTIDTVDTSPFKKLVMTIGELPTSFVESMTYYETLAWFVDYLQNTIIPALNNNAEALNELQNLYTTLYNYVHDYFDNLDVQEEINNKLDQMFEDGQLTQLIAQYLTLNAVMSFPNVASMKLAENLVNGSTVETYGYYNINDNGGAKYRIRNIVNTDTVDEITKFALYDNNLIAELIINDTMNAKQFGCKGDGATDDTTRLNKAVQVVQHLFIPDGTYMVDAVNHGVQLKDNFILELNNNATIKAITNGNDHYQVINLDNISNVEIFGGTIEGERSTHTGADGEWGMCINVISCENINIHDINLINSWGDGLYVNIVDGMQTQNVHVDNARRNGYSLISAENFTSINDFIENINGTAPQAGVDLETNLTTDVLKNIKFDKLSTTNCTSVGFKIFIENVNTSDKYDITLTNYHSDDEYRGVEINLFDGVKGNFRIIDGLFTNTEVNAINILNSYNSEQIINIVRPTIVDYNTTHVNNVNYSAIMVKGREDTTDCGNVAVIEPFFALKDTNSELAQVRCFTVIPSENQKSKQIKFIDPLQMEAVHSNRYRTSIRVDSCESLILSDKNHVMTIDQNTSPSLSSTQIHANYESSTFTADHNVTIDPSAPIGTQVRITKGSASGDVNVKFASGEYCYPLSQNAQATIKLSGSIGSSITIRKISSTVWYALESIGTLA